MSHQRMPRRLPALFAVSAVLLGVLLLSGSSGTTSAQAACSDPGLNNPGFESGIDCWTPGPVADAAAVVGAEGPEQFAAYSTVPGGPLTVEPLRGEKMLRLGTPKSISSSQTVGANTVSQIFTPNSNTLEFSFRLFSWEFRGNDTFRIDLTKSNGQALNGSSAPFIQRFEVKSSKATIFSCEGKPPCIGTIKQGKSGDFLDSGIVEVTITNVPTNQGPLKLAYTVAGTKNNAHATWGYFDNVNEPPVAKFTILHPSVALEVDDDGNPLLDGEGNPILVGPIEGVPLHLVDLSTDDGAIVAWEWTISGPGLPAGGIKLNSQSPFFIPADDGPYSVSLKVTDDEGLSDTGNSGSNARDGTPIPALNVHNAPPLPNALNLEVLAGQEANLFGRFSDSGWLDDHTAEWTVNGGNPAAALEEDHSPALGMGVVTGQTGPVGASTSGNLCVTDDFPVSRCDAFDITVLPDTPATRENHEPNNSIDEAKVLTTDGAYLSFIQSSGDKDYFEVKWPSLDGPGGEDLPPGTEVLASLKNLPADYDLILVSVPPEGGSTAGFAFSGFAFSGFAFSGFAFSDLPSLIDPYTAGFAFSGTDSAGFAFSGLERSSYAESGFAFSGFAFSGFAFSGFAFSGFAFSPFDVNGFAFSPVSQYSTSIGLNSDISSTDVQLAELALGGLPEGARVVGFSANQGTLDETVFARIDVPGTKLYAVVVGSNGAFSSDPYTLQLEASMPLVTAALHSDDPFAVLDGHLCLPEEPRFSVANAGLTPLHAASDSPNTLFVTQRERMEAIHGAPETAAMLAELETLADHAQVNGKIISVPTDIYDAWDASPCDVAAANAVTNDIREIIMTELEDNPSIEYVVLVGDDDIVPFRRVPDETIISNERYYLGSSYLKAGSPLFSSVQGGFNLSDDYYVDRLPSPWQGRELYIPDLAIGRLVETPTEIMAQAQAFVASDGELVDTSPRTAFVAGYDFFDDGSQEIADLLAAAGYTVDALINDTWTADLLRCHLLGLGDGCPVPAIIGVPNAHFTHYAALSAGGFETHDFDDVLRSSDVVASGSGSGLLRRLIFTIGCHAGFSMPAGSNTAADPTMNVDTALDFAQAMAQQRAVYIASTGFGLGETQGLGGTELLLVLFSEELFGHESAGQALVSAKQAYLTGLPAVSVYDEKSSIQTTLYGLPMYRVPGQGGGATGASIASVTAAEVSAATVSDLLTVTPDLSGPHNTPDGSYWSADDGFSTVPYRPLQPKVVEDLPASPDGPVHGVLLKAGTFTDQTVDPVIARPTFEWEDDAPEPQVCLPTFWPSELTRVNSLDTGVELIQRLVVTPGQFRCDNPGPPVTGTQRLFDSLGLEILRSNDPDTTPPAIASIDLSGSAANVLLTVAASDPAGGSPPVAPTGIARIVVVKISESTGTLTAIVDEEIDGNPLSGIFDISLGGLAAGDSLIIQVADGAGNVTTYTGKGANLKFISVDAGPDQNLIDGVPTTFNVVVSGHSTAGAVNYFMDFGDGTTDSGLVPANGELTLEHQYSRDNGMEFTARIRVTDASGGIGGDVVLLTYCHDPLGDVNISPDATIDAGKADLVGCRVTATATHITITLKTASVLTDGNGAPATGNIQYRVQIDLPNGNVQMRYRNGQTTGLSGLVVTVVGNELRFTFPKSSIGWTGANADNPITWRSETQAGAQASPGAGSLDSMPDSGFFTSPLVAAQ